MSRSLATPVAKNSTLVLFLLLASLVPSTEVAALQLPMGSSGWLPDPAASSTEMRNWAKATVSTRTTPTARLQALSEALLGPHGLNLVEDDRFTPTALQAFTLRRADCVGFAFLAQALGRAVDLELELVVVDQVIERERQGGYEIERRHLAVALGTSATPLVLDFGGLEQVDPRRLQPIDELTGQAIFLANRSAQSLLAGNNEQALLWGRAAIVLAPDLAAARNNFAAAWRRQNPALGASGLN